MKIIRSRSASVATYTALGIAAAFSLLPLVLLVLNSVKGSADIMLNPLSFPNPLRFDNLARAWEDSNFNRTFLNTAIITGLTIVLVCITSSATAYVLARKKVREWRFVSAYLLAASTVPIQLFMFPLYFVMARLQLINNLVAVSFIYTALSSPFAVMLMRTYFIAVPKEIEEAAIVDGANPWQVFTRVVMPIVFPGVLTVALIVGLSTWNEFLIAATFLTGRDSQTAVMSFALLSGRFTTDWGEVMAGALLIVLPVVLLFVVLQRRFIEGMAAGSVNG